MQTEDEVSVTEENEKIWIWFNGATPQEPMSIEELQKAAKKGLINDDTTITTIQNPDKRFPYRTVKKFTLRFDPPEDALLKNRLTERSTVFSGPNNSGKTFLLKSLRTELGSNTYLIACGRIHSIQYLPNSSDQNTNDLHDQAIQQIANEGQNQENNSLSLERIIADHDDKTRKKLFEICEEMLGNKFKVERKNKNNALSQYYVDMDGENLGYGSTGTRILMTLLGIILDKRFNILLIDEPELGLSPKIQSILAQYLLNPQIRKSKFPHLRHVFIATHSHLFLDSTLSNNFIVSKSGKTISTKQITTINDFNHLQFNLLGNRLESLYLPSKIILVEGPSDHPFILKLVHLFIPDKKITVVNCGGAGEVQNKLRILEEALGELEQSPYHNNVHVVFDSKHPAKKDRILKFGIPEEHITTSKQNGIEYYYPKAIIASIFRCDPENPFKSAIITDSEITINNITKPKTELSRIVTDKLTEKSELHDELRNFLNKLG